MSKYLYFLLLFILVSCSPSSVKLVDEYYIYSPDEYCDSYYLKCKLSSDADPVIDSVSVVYWNDSTIIIGRCEEKREWWVVKASGDKLKCCNNDIVNGRVSENLIMCYLAKAKFKRLVFE